MAVLAVSTPAELCQQLRYLKAENEALRAELKDSVRVTLAQRARVECLGRFIVRGTRHLDRVG